MEATILVPVHPMVLAAGYILCFERKAHIYCGMATPCDCPPLPLQTLTPEEEAAVTEFLKNTAT